MTTSRSGTVGWLFAPAWALLLAVVATDGPPPVIPASGPDSAFSAERAMRHVEMIASAPRPPGSAEHRRVVALIDRELAGLGLVAERHEAVGVSGRGEVAGRVVNLLVRLPGTGGGGRAILLATHHDGVWSGPAAGDNASGVAVVLEILRALRAGAPLDHDVIAVFTDGEEAGLLGAAAFASGHRWAEDVEVVINIDARGTRGRSVMFEAIGGDRDLIEALRRVGDIETTSFWRPVFRVAGGNTDLSALRALDRPGFNFGFLDGVDRYHTIEDDVAHLDPRSVQHHGDQTLALTRILGREPLPRTAKGDATWFPVAGIGLAIYSKLWSGILTVTAVGLAVLLVARLRRQRGPAFRGAAIGAIATVASAIAGVCAAGAIVTGVVVLGGHGGIGDPGVRDLYAAAIVVAVGAVTIVGWRVARRFADAPDIRAGGIVIWAFLALLTHWRAPEASFVFAWPALLLAAAEQYALNGRTGAAPVRILAHAAALAIVVPIWYPVVVLAGIHNGGAIVLGFLSPLLLGQVLAALDGGLVMRWRRWTMGGLGAALVLLGLMAVGRSAPVANPVRVGYAVDVVDGRAWLVTPTSSPESWRATVARAAGATPEREPGAEPPWLGRVFPRRTTVLSNPVIPAERPEPFVTVVRDAAVGAVREVTLRIDGLRDVLEVELATSTAVSGATIDGHSFAPRHLPTDRPWSISYVAPSDSGMTVSLTTAKAGTIEVLVRALGLPAWFEEPFASTRGNPIQSVTTRVQRIDLSRTGTPASVPIQ